TVRISYPEIYALAEEWWDDGLRMANEARIAHPYGLYSGSGTSGHVNSSEKSVLETRGKIAFPKGCGTTVVMIALMIFIVRVLYFIGSF
ncbi:MAG: hypothetical protein ABIC40_04420, partial [bacterium]